MNNADLMSLERQDRIASLVNERGSLTVPEALELREACKARHFAVNDAGRFARLLSIADLDAFLRTDGAQIPRIAMADEGAGDPTQRAGVGEGLM